MHILSPETDNCPSWISGRERMTVETISWSISMKESCRPRRGSNLRPPGLQSDTHPTAPPRPFIISFRWREYLEDNFCCFHPKILSCNFNEYLEDRFSLVCDVYSLSWFVFLFLWVWLIGYALWLWLLFLSIFCCIYPKYSNTLSTCHTWPKFWNSHFYSLLVLLHRGI